MRSLLAKLGLIRQPLDPVAAFWTFVVEQVAQLRAVTSGEAPVLAGLTAALQKIDPRLAFDITATTQPIELAISADGLLELFPLVKQIVAAAPQLDGLTVVAFKQRGPIDGVEITLGDRSLKTDDIFWRAHRDGVGRGPVTLELSVRDGSDDLQTPVLMLLQLAVGEHDLAVKIATIELTELPETFGPELQPLRALPTFLDAQE